MIQENHTRRDVDSKDSAGKKNPGGRNNVNRVKKLR